MNSNQSIASLREDYRKASLSESDIDPDPLRQFSTWFDEARNAQLPEVNAMALSTVNSQGRPTSRIVLLKGLEQCGFTFYTNYNSSKGAELAANPHAALLFLWYPLERQVRIEGTISQISPAESDAYYNERPLGSRIGAWASPQSEVITREQLEANQERYAKQYGDNPPRPAHWGGYRLMPEMIEFWQGRSSRLHDRIRFRRNQDAWTIDRLAP